MAGKPSKHRERIYDMLRQGESVKRISELTGLSTSAVHKYRAELNEPQPQRPKEHIDMPMAFWKDWTQAVNRIRRYLGKAEFPMPKEAATKTRD